MLQPSPVEILIFLALLAASGYAFWRRIGPVIDTIRRSTLRTTPLPAAFAVSFNSGLKSIDRPFHPRLPAAPQRLIEADDREQPRQLRLPHRVLRLK